MCVSSINLKKKMTTIAFDELNSQKDNLKIIDVRNKTEIQENGKIPGSLNLPMTELEAGLDMDDEAFASKFGFQKPTSNDTIVTHCLKGGRAMKAYSVFEEKCYSGSFDDWVKNGGKVVRDTNI